MIHTILTVVLFATTWLCFVYKLAANVRMFTHAFKNSMWYASRELMLELRVVMLIALPVDVLNIIQTEHAFWLGFTLFIQACYWFFAYFDRDDRWKRRRKKALSKVKEIGGKLVVVPIAKPVSVSA